MLGIKKLDIFILKNFSLIFVGAFFICLFVFMMQFTWRYVDELIGKGLSLEILGKFFWYMGITLVPTSLPLAVLLASLIAFGNMGERLELLAMKAAGVPLIRIMSPILFVVIALTGLSFYFQNTISPHAQISLRTLLFSMKQTSPAVEIPEGVFYSGVPNVNLYVQKKNAETGMLYQVIIYKTDQGFDRAQIVLADSGRLEMTADKLHLKLELWNGEQFENLQAQNISALQSSSVPYDRETFGYKNLLIDFDSNFNMMDQDLLSGLASAKDMKEIEHSIDSVSKQLDSIGKAYYASSASTLYKNPRLAGKDSISFVKAKKGHIPNFDKLVASLPSDKRIAAFGNAMQSAKNVKSDVEWKSMVIKDSNMFIRRHWVEWHQKMTLSLACLFFFFVGAPLGAIIRKGGLGMPTVISVLIFIFYYIINTSGMKLARDGTWQMWYGMWVSSFVLMPFGVVLTYKANKDSAMFNIEVYGNALKRLLGIRSSRHIFRKEVIIEDPDYAADLETISAIRQECQSYMDDNKLYRFPNYAKLFFAYKRDKRVANLAREMEALIEDLSNSRHHEVLQALGTFPVIYSKAHTTPIPNKRLNMLAGILFPVGIVLWLRIWRFRLRLLKDLKQTIKSCNALETAINNNEK